MAVLTNEQQSGLLAQIRRLRDELLDAERSMLDVMDVNTILNDVESAQETINSIVQRLEDING